MEAIQKHLGSAVQTLTIPTATPLPITDVEPYFSKWALTGNETAEERKSLGDMLEAAKTFCRSFLAQTEPHWLCLTGRSGCGKTLLAECIRNLWKDHADTIYEKAVRPRLDPQLGNPSHIWSYAQQGLFMRKWTKSADAMRDGNYYRATELANDWCKIIDDFGAESMDREGKPTHFIIGQMGKIADGRLGKWTVITSNFSRRELGEVFDVRIASRMMRDGNVCVHCDARDFNIRLQKKQAA